MHMRHAGLILLLVFGIAALWACGSSSPGAPAPAAASTASATATPTPVPDCGLSFVPFEEILYIATPAANADIKDRVVVGRMTLANGFRLFDLPEPAATNERFCRDVTLGPGYTGPAYVPTLAEKRGDFSRTRVVLIDPLTRAPFPNNIIPSSLSPGVIGWRIPPS